MLNPNMIEEKVMNLFKQELNLDIKVNGKKAIKRIENNVIMNGLNGECNLVEDIYCFKNKEYTVFYKLVVTRKEDMEKEEHEWDTDIKFVDVELSWVSKNEYKTK